MVRVVWDGEEQNIRLDQPNQGNYDRINSHLLQRSVYEPAAETW